MDRRAGWAIKSMRSQRVRRNWVTTTPGTQPRAAVLPSGRRERTGRRQQKRGSGTRGRSFRKEKGCFRFLVAVAVVAGRCWIRERLWNMCICPLRNQSQTQEAAGRASAATRLASAVGAAAAQAPLVGRQDRTLSVPWPQPPLQGERRGRLKFFPVTECMRTYLE